MAHSVVPHRSEKWPMPTPILTSAPTPSPTTAIALVAAPRRQRGVICRAREQFDPSPVFRHARNYCERGGGEWYILSAAHDLLAPHQVIGPEPRSLPTLSAEERASWAKGVAAALGERAAG